MEETSNKREELEIGEQNYSTIKQKKQHIKDNSQIRYRRVSTMMMIIGLIGIAITVINYINNKSNILLGAKNEREIVLLSDIGGTNCRLKLVEMSGKKGDEMKEIESKVLKPWNYKNIEELLVDFLRPFKNTKNYPKYAILGIPGAITGNTMHELVNVENWPETDGDKLAEKLGIKELHFINDFVIIGYGIQSDLKEGEDYIVLKNKDKLNDKEKKFIIGPGTGLGVCYLIKNENKKYYNVYGSEGSHQDFAPRDQFQLNYMNFVQKYFNNIKHVSAETACAGPSIVPMYQYLYLNNSEGALKSLSDRVLKLKSTDNPDELNNVNFDIVQSGLDKSDKVARRVLEFFVELLGHISGNMGVYTLPYGGIYIVGGLSKTIREIYQTEIFQKALLSRGEQNNLLDKMPIVLVLNDQLGMLGAIEYARILIDNKLN